jgi:hypothetical protein
MSLGDLNSREGFFRSWVLVSIIWVIVLGTVCVYPTVVSYIESRKAAQELKRHRDEAILDLANTPIYPKELSPKEVATFEAIKKIMPFNLKAARRAGKTDKQIAEYLTREFERDTQDLNEPGATPTKIVKYFASHKPQDFEKHHLQHRGWSKKQSAKIVENLMKDQIDHSGVQIPEGVSSCADTKAVYFIRDPQSGKKILFRWILSTPPTCADMREIFGVDVMPEMQHYRAFCKTTGKYTTENPFIVKEEDQIEFVQSGKWEEVHRVAASEASRGWDVLFYLGTTFLPPAIALALGMGVMWVFRGFVPNKKPRTPFTRSHWRRFHAACSSRERAPRKFG